MRSKTWIAGALSGAAFAVSLAASAAYSVVYYPSVEVYQDPARAVWFWNSGGAWQSGEQLPPEVRQFTTGGVTVQVNSDRPYEQHAAMVQRYGRGDPRKMSGDYEDRKYTKPAAYPDP